MPQRTVSKVSAVGGHRKGEPGREAHPRQDCLPELAGGRLTAGAAGGWPNLEAQVFPGVGHWDGVPFWHGVAQEGSDRGEVGVPERDDQRFPEVEPQPGSVADPGEEGGEGPPSRRAALEDEPEVIHEGSVGQPPRGEGGELAQKKVRPPRHKGVG